MSRGTTSHTPETCAACAKHEACPVWNGATYYNVGDDAGELQFEREDEAIQDYLDDLDADELAELNDEEAEREIEVFAYERDAGPDSKWFERVSTREADDIADAWDESFGSMDGDSVLDDAARAKLADAIGLLLRGVFAGKTVWQCSEVARRTFSFAFVREYVEAEIETRKAHAERDPS